MGKALKCADCVACLACSGSRYCNLFQVAVCEEAPACSQYVARGRTYKVAPPCGSIILVTNDKGDAVCRVDTPLGPWPPPDCPVCETTDLGGGRIGVTFIGAYGEIRSESDGLAALDALAHKFCRAVAALRSQEK